MEEFIKMIRGLFGKKNSQKMPMGKSLKFDETAEKEAESKMTRPESENESIPRRRRKTPNETRDENTIPTPGNNSAQNSKDNRKRV